MIRDFQDIIQDESIMTAISSGDFNALMANPKIVKLMNNSSVQEIKKRWSEVLARLTQLYFEHTCNKCFNFPSSPNTQYTILHVLFSDCSDLRYCYQLKVVNDS